MIKAALDIGVCRAALKPAFWVIAFGVSGAALSQTYIQPPEYAQVDTNGVDLLSGSASLSIKLGSIGSGIGELSFSDYWSSAGLLNSLYNTLYFTLDEHREKYSLSLSFDNSSETFVEERDWSYTPKRNFDYLTSVAGASPFVLTRPDGEVRTYSAPPNSGNLSYLLLMSRAMPNGVTWLYDWQVSNGLARPISLTNNLGYKISLAYLSDQPPNSSNQSSVVAWLFVTTVQFFNLAQSLSALSSASQTGSVDAAQIVTDGGQTWSVSGRPSMSYPYGVSSVPFKVKRPSSSSFNYSYTPASAMAGSVSTSATVNGQTYNYNFVLNSGSVVSNGVTTVTDPLGSRTEVKFNTFTSIFSSAAFPSMITDGLNRVTNYEAADYYLPTSITRPAGDKDIFIYQGGGMITQVVHKAQPNSGLADTTESATYPASCTSKFICNKPTSYTDRSGKTTFYDYASEHGGLLTENLPADANGIRSVKRYRYAQRYAWILNGSGGYMKAATPVWLKTEERTCRTSSTVNDACGGGAADEVVTTFDYGADAGPNNLLLRSMAVASGGQTLRTCLTYDAKGNKLSETKPLGTGSGCP